MQYFNCITFLLMKKLKMLAWFLVFLLSFSLVNAASITNVETVDINTLKLSTESNIQFPNWNVNWMLKLLKDIKVTYSAKDPANPKKVVLNLTGDLTTNTSYSLMTVLWADWDIDFSIWTTLAWEIVNSSIDEWAQTWVKKVNIIDKRTIELYFAQDLTEDVFEFKILSEIVANNLSSTWNNSIIVEVESDLVKLSDYIIMVVWLEDKDWNTVDFWQWLYDFVTPKKIPWKKAEPKPENTESVNTPPTQTAEVAMNSAETPDTWAATWVLIALAVLLNLVFIIRKKILS